MSRLAKLRAATTMADVAAILGFKTSALAYVLYSKVAPAKYQTFQIPKKAGGTRVIEAPNPRLKLIQRRLADLLQDCDAEIREKYGRHDAGPYPDAVSHGFVRNRSILSNAHQHRCRRLVFNVDLEDFFPSINFGRIRGFFIRDSNWSLQASVATVLAQIASSGNHLPQGSPCSPVVANLVAHILDVHLVRLARQSGCTYTRYADDLSFSTNKKAFSGGVAILVDTETHQWTVGSELCRLIVHCGFRVNPKKTRMQYCASRQEVTGLVVNKKVNVSSTYRRRVRAMVHRLVTTGTFDAGMLPVANPEPGISNASGTMAQLQGMLAFIDTVDVHNRRLAPNRKDTALTSKELTYRRFLLYKDFYAADLPVIVCEGKTDNVYLAHAIRGLAAQYPRLAAVDASGAVRLSVRRYHYAGRSTGRILGIRGGHGDLRNLLQAYRNATERFAAPGFRSAVVLVIDNDDGAKAILAAIKEMFKVQAQRADPFIHVFENVYVVFTPLPPGADKSVIEDCFDTATRGMTLNGRSFSESNDYSPVSCYGKSEFAHKVVAPNSNRIDFNGFAQLLTNISSAIEHHAARVTHT
jgi:RNA-directed DNA polymerase